MSDNYVIWRYKLLKHGAALTNLRGLERAFRLTDGTPLAASFPADVSLQFNPDFPNDLLLADNMKNTSSLAIVSERLAAVVRDQVTTGIELLPVSLLDHKGGVASKDYFIVHPVDPLDCIDREQSVFEESLIARGEIEFFDRLVLDDTRIPAERKVFRLKGFPDIILVQRELAEHLDGQGMSGLGWLPIDEYPEL
jgi:hypothetical protein